MDKTEAGNGMRSEATFPTPRRALHQPRPSRRDRLTGLLNRQGCIDDLASALSEGHRRHRNAGADGSNRQNVAFVLADIDDFRSINESLGYELGDRILWALGERVQRSMPASATLARFGGDEFAMVLRNVEPAAAVAEVARQMLRLFAQPFEVGGHERQLQVSIGMAVAEADDTALDLLRYAEAALYRAKDSGRNRFQLFDTALRTSFDAQAGDERELRSAVAEGQIVAYVQPFVSLITGEVLGGEALARWMHPDGLRHAGAFIATAERANLLGDISLAVLEQVRDAKVRSSALAKCSVSVNVPPAAINQVMKQVDAQSNHLEGLLLEITENGLIDDLEQARRFLNEARAAGAKVLFDDLGVGEAPLALLTELPLDGIKIDRDFVSKLETNLAARAVVEAIVKAAECMNLWVVAEGVETVSQATLLQKLGVPAAQGYLFAPAVPLPEFEKLVERQEPFAVPRSDALTASPACRVSP